MVGGVDDKLTKEAFDMLYVINEVCKNNTFKIAPVAEIIRLITEKRAVKSISVRKSIWSLARSGLVENPIRGCWRLTSEGHKVLEEILSNSRR